MAGLSPVGCPLRRLLSAISLRAVSPCKLRRSWEGPWDTTYAAVLAGVALDRETLVKAMEGWEEAVALSRDRRMWR